LIYKQLSLFITALNHSLQIFRQHRGHNARQQGKIFNTIVHCWIRVVFLERGIWRVLLTESDEASLDHAAPVPRSHAGFAKPPTTPQISFACLLTVRLAATNTNDA